MTETRKITDQATGTTYDLLESVLYNGETVARILAVGDWGGTTYVELEIPAQGGRRLAANLDHIRKLTHGLF